MTRTLLADLEKVPPFPAVAAKLLARLSSPNVAIPEIVELIRSDAGLTVRLLQYVNSPLYGRPARISEVDLAVGLLGLDQTRSITAVHAASGYTRRAPSNAELQTCWQHSVATAVLADEIGQACGAFTKLAFTAGILHDVGRLGLMVAFPLEYSRALRDADRPDFNLLNFEREQFGVDHADAGGLLGDMWNLPEEFSDIAAQHHLPLGNGELDLLRVVHVACRLADALGYGFVPPSEDTEVRAIMEDLPAKALRHLPGNSQDLNKYVQQHITRII